MLGCGNIGKDTLRGSFSDCCALFSQSEVGDGPIRDLLLIKTLVLDKLSELNDLYE